MFSLKRRINGPLVKHVSQDIKQIQLKNQNNIPIRLNLKSDKGLRICSEIHKPISFVWKKEELSEECKKSVTTHIYNKAMYI